MGNDFGFVWHDKEVLRKTNLLMKNVSKEVAEDVVRDAKRILKRDAKRTTDKGLLDQFSVEKSKFKDGGYLAYSQGPGNWRKPYHAAFVELGNVWIHPYGDKTKNKINLPAIPYMRPARKKNIRSANKKFQDGLDKL